MAGAAGRGRAALALALAASLAVMPGSPAHAGAANAAAHAATEHAAAAVNAEKAAGETATTAAYQTVTVPQALLPSGAVGPALLRWNPCGQLRYAVDTAGAPTGFAAEARRAVGQMARASGLAWTYAGLTKIRPDLAQPAAVPDRMRSEDLQLVISWTTRPDGGTSTGGESAGTLRNESGTVTTDENGVQTVSPTQLTEAAIVIDRSQESLLVANDRRGNGLYRLLLHQLGHAVGLDHVSDPREIMNPVPRRDGPVSYGPGDLAGLRKIGRGAGCL